MAARAIVSYDGTDNDADAIALGRVLRRAGVDLSLAYVRHAPDPDQQREVVEREKAERLLDAGAALLGPPDAQRHVVLSASTPEGLAMLATDLHADLIVFGSEYRTPEGSVQPGTSAQRLLDSASIAVGVAPAGMREWTDAHIAAIKDVASDGADEVAASLATALGGSVVDVADAETLVLATAARASLDDARVPVIVVPGGSGLTF